MQGNIVLSQGTFTLNSDNDDLFFKRDIMNTTEAVVDFFKDGFVEFDVLDFAAHIELESAVTRAQELLTFSIPFPNITLTPFQVCRLTQGDVVSSIDEYVRFRGLRLWVPFSAPIWLSELSCKPI